MTRRPFIQHWPGQGVRIGWLEVAYFGKPHRYRWGFQFGEKFGWNFNPPYRRHSLHLGRIRVLFPVKPAP